MGRGKTAELILNWDVRNMDEYLMILEANAQVIWFIGMVQRIIGNMVVVRNRVMENTLGKGCWMLLSVFWNWRKGLW